MIALCINSVSLFKRKYMLPKIMCSVNVQGTIESGNVQQDDVLFAKTERKKFIHELRSTFLIQFRSASSPLTARG